MPFRAGSHIQRWRRHADCATELRHGFRPGSRYIPSLPAIMPDLLVCGPVEGRPEDRRCAQITQLQASRSHRRACVNAWTESLPSSVLHAIITRSKPGVQTAVRTESALFSRNRQDLTRVLVSYRTFSQRWAFRPILHGADPPNRDGNILTLQWNVSIISAVQRDTLTKTRQAETLQQFQSFDFSKQPFASTQSTGEPRNQEEITPRWTTGMWLRSTQTNTPPANPARFIQEGTYNSR